MKYIPANHTMTKKRGGFLLTSVPRKYKKLLFISIPALAIFVAIIAYVYEYTSTTNYCGTTCHIMKEAYETQLHSVHREELVGCGDCHLYHGPNIIYSLAYKGYSGMKDVYKNAFDQPVVLHTSQWSQKVIQKNCLRCHESVVTNINITDGTQCFDCHRNTPHGQGTQSFGTQVISTPFQTMGGS